VRVSWFAAKAYCAWRGGRLPTEREWELAAQASVDRADAHRGGLAGRDPGLVRGADPDVLPAVGRGTANAWGVHDLHGLVWEWVYDFGAALVASDDRERGDAARDKYCGAGAALARDPRQYATFMRLAFRSSLQARYTTANLGFRCAADAAAAGHMSDHPPADRRRARDGALARSAAATSGGPRRRRAGRTWRPPAAPRPRPPPSR
jgi:sulfatase modifying factor 1